MAEADIGILIFRFINFKLHPASNPNEAAEGSHFLGPTDIDEIRASWQMHIFVLVASAFGPAYLAVNGSPIAWVLLWSIVWTSLRFLMERRVVVSVLNEPTHEPPSWLDQPLERQPILCMAGTFAISLLALTFVHVSVYWIVRSVAEQVAW